MSALASAAGSVEAGQAQGNVDSANAANQRTAADSAQATAAANASQLGNQTSRILGQAKAGAAASGVSGTSPLAVMHDIAQQGELSRQLTLYKGRQQARGQLAGAAISTGEGQQAIKAGDIAAGTTVLTAAEQAASTMMGG